MKDLVEIFKALSDENRIKILQMLSNGELCACDIQDQFQLTQPTISHHMKVLMQSGLVESEKRGKWMFYFISKEKVDVMCQFIKEITCGSNTYAGITSLCDCDETRRK